MTDIRFTWTPDLVAEVRRRWLAGDSASKIANAMGLTKGQVIGKVQRSSGFAKRGMPEGIKKFRERKQSLGLLPPKAKPKAAPIVSVGARQATYLNRGLNRYLAINPGFTAAPLVGGCRYITAENFIERMNRGEQIFCGKKIEREGGSYCPKHDAVCHVHTKQINANYYAKDNSDPLAYVPKKRGAA